MLLLTCCCCCCTYVNPKKACITYSICSIFINIYPQISFITLLSFHNMYRKQSVYVLNSFSLVVQPLLSAGIGCISCNAKSVHLRTHSPMLMHTYTRQLHDTTPVSAHSKQIILWLHSSSFFPHSQNRHSVSSLPTIHHNVPGAAWYCHQNTVCFWLVLCL